VTENGRPLSHPLLPLSNRFPSPLPPPSIQEGMNSSVGKWLSKISAAGDDAARNGGAREDEDVRSR
jgi:hypothetical protein